ncbi:NAD(P)/FAD-dependent oxidoreductase [Shouchella lehensis]|uniref:NAD(P)/FAD-dependent oxidoreductase n=2 Tax=Shouchella lehensis TaxID=300825 RepID=A0A4Y7WE95_9BACI|nr:NAD(P)/FAD-dependent oxidoreductase [Shouchella lehensis]
MSTIRERKFIFYASILCFFIKVLGNKKANRGGVKMVQAYDVIIIGSGPAAMAAAFPLAEATKRVAVIEGNRFGGTCPNFGCDPKKMLYTRSEAAWQAGKLRGTGIEGTISFNWEDAMKEKNTYTDSVYQEIEQSLKKANIDTYHGYASFINEETVQVDHITLSATTFIIATGLMPSPLPFKGAETLLTNEAFLNLPSLPKSIAFIGGGYISFEFAHLAARAGANVHIIDSGHRGLKAFDQDHVQALIKQSEALGITFHWNEEISSIESNAHDVTIKTDKQTLTVDKAVHGAGRTPNIKKLNLEAANIHYDEAGIHVNNTLQSISNPRVYAAGDVTATHSLPLTPLSSHEGSVVVHNILEEQKQTLQQGAMPSVVFTIPKLAKVGKTKELLDQEGIAYDVKNTTMTDWLTYSMIKEDQALAKVYVCKKTGKILGADFLTIYADQWINLLSLAIQLELTTEQLTSVHYTYPSVLGDSGNVLPIK